MRIHSSPSTSKPPPSSRITSNEALTPVAENSHNIPHSQHHDNLHSTNDINNNNKNHFSDTYTKILNGNTIISPTNNSNFFCFVFTDLKAIDRINCEHDTSFVESFQKITLVGYEAYIVEQWVLSREVGTVICTYTGNSNDVVTAYRIKVNRDENLWSPYFKGYLSKLYYSDYCRPTESTVGVIFLTNLFQLANLALVPIPKNSDVISTFSKYLVNNNLKKLGCGSRSTTSSEPTKALEDKFKQMFKISNDVSLQFASRELVCILQTILYYYDLFNPFYCDGLLCMKTEKAVKDWWLEYSNYPFLKWKPSQNEYLTPKSISSIIGFTILLKSVLEMMGNNIVVPKDLLDVEKFRVSLGQFQKYAGLHPNIVFDNQFDSNNSTSNSNSNSNSTASPLLLNNKRSPGKTLKSTSSPMSINNNTNNTTQKSIVELKLDPITVDYIVQSYIPKNNPTFRQDLQKVGKMFKNTVIDIANGKTLQTLNITSPLNESLNLNSAKDSAKIFEIDYDDFDQVLKFIQGRRMLYLWKGKGYQVNLDQVSLASTFLYQNSKSQRVRSKLIHDRQQQQQHTHKNENSISIGKNSSSDGTAADLTESTNDNNDPNDKIRTTSGDIIGGANNTTNLISGIKDYSNGFGYDYINESYNKNHNMMESGHDEYTNNNHNYEYDHYHTPNYLHNTDNNYNHNLENNFNGNQYLNGFLHNDYDNSKGSKNVNNSDLNYNTVTAYEDNMYYPQSSFENSNSNFLNSNYNSNNNSRWLSNDYGYNGNNNYSIGNFGSGSDYPHGYNNLHHQRISSSQSGNSSNRNTSGNSADIDPLSEISGYNGFTGLSQPQSRLEPPIMSKFFNKYESDINSGNNQYTNNFNYELKKTKSSKLIHQGSFQDDWSNNSSTKSNNNNININTTNNNNNNSLKRNLSVKSSNSKNSNFVTSKNYLIFAHRVRRRYSIPMVDKEINLDSINKKFDQNQTDNIETENFTQGIGQNNLNLNNNTNINNINDSSIIDSNDLDKSNNNSTFKSKNMNTIATNSSTINMNMSINTIIDNNNNQQDRTYERFRSNNSISYGKDYQDINNFHPSSSFNPRPDSDLEDSDIDNSNDQTYKNSGSGTDFNIIPNDTVFSGKRNDYILHMHRPLNSELINLRRSHSFSHIDESLSETSYNSIVTSEGIAVKYLNSLASYKLNVLQKLLNLQRESKSTNTYLELRNSKLLERLNLTFENNSNNINKLIRRKNDVEEKILKSERINARLKYELRLLSTKSKDVKQNLKQLRSFKLDELEKLIKHNMINIDKNKLDIKQQQQQQKLKEEQELTNTNLSHSGTPSLTCDISRSISPPSTNSDSDEVAITDQSHQNPRPTTHKERWISVFRQVLFFYISWIFQFFKDLWYYLFPGIDSSRIRSSWNQIDRHGKVKILLNLALSESEMCHNNSSVFANNNKDDHENHRDSYIDEMTVEDFVDGKVKDE